MSSSQYISLLIWALARRPRPRPQGISWQRQLCKSQQPLQLRRPAAVCHIQPTVGLGVQSLTRRGPSGTWCRHRRGGAPEHRRGVWLAAVPNMTSPHVYLFHGYPGTHLVRLNQLFCKCQFFRIFVQLESTPYFCCFAALEPVPPECICCARCIQG